MGLAEFVTSLGANPYFSAGAGLFGVASGLAVLRYGWKMGGVIARHRYLVTLEMSSKDRSYYWTLQWLSARAARNSQHLSVQTSYKQLENGQIDTSFSLVPSPGRHYIQYKGRFIQVERQREKNVMDLNTGTPWESLTLTMLGRNRQVFADLLEEAKEMALAQEEGKTLVYTPWGNEWRQFGYPRRKRPLHSVILDQDIANKILGDVTEFLQSSSWYIDRGIPYRRGYLFYGPPGTGKSSFITALAGELQYNICLLSLSDRGLTDDRLSQLMSAVPPRSITLLEDIDAAFIKRTASPEEKWPVHAGVTLSGLLNTLDGVASTEERLLFMTTNYIDRLDPALVRPGRVDYKQYFGKASEMQIEKMFKRFYPESADRAQEFYSKIRGKELSMADLQGFLLLYKGDAEQAIAKAGELLH